MNNQDKCVQVDENKENADEFPISGDPSKYVTLPVQNEQIWRKYQATLEWFWTAHDVYLANDYEHMIAIFDEDQQKCLKEILAVMYSIHHLVINKELFMQLMTQVDIKEASYYFGSQADAKKTHSMMYSLILDELIRDEQKKECLLSDIISTPAMRDFLRWAILNTTSSTESFAHRLMAFASVQGIIFAVPFMLFKWIHKQHANKMPGLSTSNQYISRDENLNLSFSCMLFDYIDNDLESDEAKNIIQSAVSYAKELFLNLIPVQKFDLDPSLLAQFIEHSADRVLLEAKMKSLFGKESPFDWAEEVVVENHNSKIQTHNVIDIAASYGEATFSTDLEF